MRRRFIHPLADLFLHVGWSYAVIPLCIFAGVVTFGVQAGPTGALLGGVAGFLLGAGFVVAWRLVTARRPSPSPPASTAPSPRARPRRAPEPIPIPQLEDGEVVIGADAVRQSDHDVALDRTGLGATPASQAHADQKAALKGDLDRAVALLREGWEMRDQLFLDPSTALAIGTHATQRTLDANHPAVAHSELARWCLRHADGLPDERLSPLRDSLNDLRTPTD